MERKPKTVFQLDTPFTQTQLPEVSPEHQDIILDLLCSVLSPIGQYRTTHVPASKGKRDKKRKRQDAKLKGEPSDTITPPPPEIASSVVVGLSSITRKLEELSQLGKPANNIHESPNSEDTSDSKTPEAASESGEKASQSHFAAIFVLSQFSPALQDHLPRLVATASLAHPSLPVTRLVQISKGGEAQVCSALGLQRASVVGILHDAPNAQCLVDYVKTHAPEIQIRWLEEARKHQFLPVKLKAIETFGWVAGKGVQKI